MVAMDTEIPNIWWLGIQGYQSLAVLDTWIPNSGSSWYRDTKFWQLWMQGYQILAALDTGIPNSGSSWYRGTKFWQFLIQGYKILAALDTEILNFWWLRYKLLVANDTSVSLRYEDIPFCRLEIQWHHFLSVSENGDTTLSLLEIQLVIQRYH